MKSGSRPDQGRKIAWILLLATLSAGIYGIISLIDRNTKSPPGFDEKNPITVEELIQNIALYRGSVRVSGRVMRLGGEGFEFLLVGEKFGTRLPVSYRGPIPKEDIQVVAVGRLILDEGERYIFEATWIKPE